MNWKKFGNTKVVPKKFKKLIREFKKIKLPPKSYAIFGGGCLAARGIRDVSDLDVIVSNKIFKKLKEKFKNNVQRISNKEIIKIGEIEIHPAWRRDPKYRLDKELKNAEMIRGIRYIRLVDLIDFKRRLGRKKDFNDIELINKYLAQNA